MVRAIVPKQEDAAPPRNGDGSGGGGVGSGGGSGSSGGDGPERRPAKRRCVQSACVPCRKRKSKCDGSVPVCSTCTAVYRSECYYDPGTERRPGRVKRDSGSVTPNRSGTSNPSPAEFLIATLKTAPTSQLEDIVRLIRSSDDIATVVDQVRNHHQTTSRAETSAGDGDLSRVMGNAARSLSSTNRHYGHSSSLGLLPEEAEAYSRPRKISMPPKKTWTEVTDDLEFVNHLFDLYFAWSHNFYCFLSKEHFLRDFRSNTLTPFCSPLLVNALCAYACHFCDRPEALKDPDNPRTAGDHFFSEARRLLFEDETPCLTTVQALAAMSIREGSNGNDSTGFMYVGRCMKMAAELGMHLGPQETNLVLLDATEREVRKITFWGCFILDSAWSLCLGRLSQLPRAAVTIDKPDYNDTYEKPVWQSAPFSHLVHSRPEVYRDYYYHIATFSELVNDCVFRFYAPRDRLTSSKLLDLHSRFRKWYSQLPPTLALKSDSQEPSLPHVFILHMYYHTVLIHLFRPFMKMESIGSTVNPRRACTDEAHEISRLIALYRKHYDGRRAHIIMTYVIMSALTVHLVNVPKDPQAAKHLNDGLEFLNETSRAHYWGVRCIKILYGMALKWGCSGYISSDFLKNCKWLQSPKIGTGDSGSVHAIASNNNISIDGNQAGRPFGTSAPDIVSANSTPPYQTGSASAIPTTPSSISGALHAGSPSMTANTNMCYSTSGVVAPGIPTSQPLTSHDQHHYHHLDPSEQQRQQQHVHSQPQHTHTHQYVPTAEDHPIFWVPFAGQGGQGPGGVPLIGQNFNASPMDLTNMLGEIPESERLARDGFQITNGFAQNGTFGPTGVASGGGGEPAYGVHSTQPVLGGEAPAAAATAAAGGYRTQWWGEHGRTAGHQAASALGGVSSAVGGG